MQFVMIAALKPINVKESSVAEHRASPLTTGISDRLTFATENDSENKNVSHKLWHHNAQYSTEGHHCTDVTYNNTAVRVPLTLTMKEVRSPSMSLAMTTVKKGAELLTVSVKETATYLRLTSPRMTVTTLMIPTTAMSHINSCRGNREYGVLGNLLRSRQPDRTKLPYILDAPIVAVMTICDSARRSGCAFNVDNMCLFPNKVTPEHRYHPQMKNRI